MSIDKNIPQIRKHTSEGVAVIELKDQPGSYFDIYGDVCSDEIASFAGFDVKAGKRARRKRELAEEAQKRIDKQVEREFGAIEEELDKEAVAGGRLELVETSKGRFSVMDGDGRVLVEDLTKKEAEEAAAELRAQGGGGK